MSKSVGIRVSKFRHLFGTPFQPRECYNDVRVGNISQEANPLTANGQFFAVPWQVPGSICVVPLSRPGAVLEETPLIINEVEEGDAAINDLKFCPHDDQLIAAACQNNTAVLWRIPPGGVESNITTPTVTLSGHSKRLLLVDFHPLASGIVVTSGADNEVKLWDLTASEQPKLELPKVHKGVITSVSWNFEGNLLATASKDKNLRLFDPRASKAVAEVASHQGAKSGKVVFLGRKEFICTIGFPKSGDREIHLHDPRNLQNKLSTLKIDSSPSGPLPFWEDDNSVLFLTGKGDGNVRFYEVTPEAPHIHYLSEFKSKDPASGFAKLPKTNCNVMKCEITRFLKLTPTGQVIPIRFEVPRQSYDFFQDDLFPDTWDRKPALSSTEWLAGSNKGPNLMSMKP
jgi:coronin-1B/1C/6